MNRPQSIRILIVAMAVLLGTTTQARESGADTDSRPAGREQGQRPGRQGPPANVEVFAMQNLAADTLSQLSGVPRDQVMMQLRLAPPHRVAENLGVDNEAFRTAMQANQQQLLEQSVAAGLITAQQAEEIAEQHKQRHVRHREGKPPGQARETRPEGPPPGYQ